jgi:hypothetical protein
LGLYYLRARYYNPATGRFLSRDPEDGKQIDPVSLHKYLYAGGDPVNMIDPRGREEEEEEVTLLQRVVRAAPAIAACGYAIGQLYFLVGHALEPNSNISENEFIFNYLGTLAVCTTGVIWAAW